jgi:hypothetical protein
VVRESCFGFGLPNSFIPIDQLLASGVERGLSMSYTDDSELDAISAPPSYCQYVGGRCDQDFTQQTTADALFLYPSEPPIIANTVEEAVRSLRRSEPDKKWNTWRDLGVAGQIIFCKICISQRFSKAVIADVTTLNFNLLFEIGYALGLDVPVCPIRDSSYIKDQKLFDELGLLDTFGYLDFANAHELALKVKQYRPQRLASQRLAINLERPLYLVKSPVQSEGMVKLMSAVKKSAVRFRSFDPRETPRLSLHEAAKQVYSSLGIILHLMSPDRRGALTHNARCAFIGGLGMAAGRRVLMLQETEVQQPVDYRDVVRSYSDPSKVGDLVQPIIRGIVERLQLSTFVPNPLPQTPLEKLDFGDLAAENEIKGLRSYFVPTGQYNDAKRGRARLVVGRKGAGKTAIFYGVRSTYVRSISHLVLDLKPEGHQFVKLREFVLSKLSPGIQQHILTAFWNYLLLMEIAHKLLEDERSVSYEDKARRRAYSALEAAYGRPASEEQADFSERLLGLVDDIVAKRSLLQDVQTTGDVTQLVYTRSIPVLNQALSDYLACSRKEDVWLLFDNLDKGWPVQSPKDEDILLLRSLLEATRKLQRHFEKNEIEFHVVVFIRNDIYQHLVLDAGDRGKDTAVILDWADPEAVKELLRKRMVASTSHEASFERLWATFFSSHVHGEESFSYILNRTLLRPREIIRFCRYCLDVAVSRGHDRVQEADVLQAEKSYSDDELVDISLEMGDLDPKYADVPYAFIDAQSSLSREEVETRIRDSGIEDGRIGEMITLLLWFGFLGLHVPPDGERYSFQFQHDLKKMWSGLDQKSVLCIHPAFHAALGCTVV